MTGIKRSRTQRTSGRVVTLTDRDLAVLGLIGACRYLTSAQIAREHFPNADRCLRRLRQLYDGGLISVVLYDSRKPNLVTLTRQGLATLSSLAPAEAQEARLAGPIRLPAIAHHLLTVDARLYARALGVKRGAPLLCWESGAGELSRLLGLPSWHVTPDGLAKYQTSEGPLVIALEVDRSTEPLKTLRSKLTRYQGIAVGGRLDALWVVVEGAEARRQHIELLLAEAGLEHWGRVLDYAHITERPVAELPARGGSTATGQRP